MEVLGANSLARIRIQEKTLHLQSLYEGTQKGNRLENMRKGGGIFHPLKGMGMGDINCAYGLEGETKRSGKNIM